MSVQDLVKEPNYISVVQTYFGFEPDSDGKLINEELAACTWGTNTSNLFLHLRTAHTKEYSTIKDGKKPRKTKSIAGVGGSG